MKATSSLTGQGIKVSRRSQSLLLHKPPSRDPFFNLGLELVREYIAQLLLPSVQQAWGCLAVTGGLPACIVVFSHSSTSLSHTNSHRGDTGDTGTTAVVVFALVECHGMQRDHQAFGSNGHVSSWQCHRSRVSPEDPSPVLKACPRLRLAAMMEKRQSPIGE